MSARFWHRGRGWSAALLALLAWGGAVGPAWPAADITIVNQNAPGEGFNDPTPFQPVGGNAATTLGEARLVAFRHAAAKAAAIIDSTVPIRVNARMDELGGDAFQAVLGSAGPTFIFRDFSVAPLAGTWYPSPLADKLQGEDLAPGQADILAVFNAAVDGSSVLGANRWYYGLDSQPPQGDVDFVTVVLHELLHGLGFMTLMDPETGAKFMGFDDAYMMHLEHHGANPASFAHMSDAERFEASNATGALHWTGNAVLSEAGELLSGSAAPFGHVEMYAPAEREFGSSLSHFDITLRPVQLMQPYYLGTNHDPGLAGPLLQDLGWGDSLADLAVGSRRSTPAPGAEDRMNVLVTVSNEGPDAAAQTVLMHKLPEGASLVAATPPAGSCSEDGGLVTCDLGELAAGGTASVSIETTLPAGGEFVNTTEVRSLTPDPNTANNSDAMFGSTASADLAVDLQDSPDPVRVGDRLSLTAIVTNEGPAMASGVRLAVSLPSEVALVSAASEHGSCTSAPEGLACQLADLAPGVSANVVIVVVPEAEGELTSIASVSADQSDPAADNNTASQQTTVTGLALESAQRAQSGGGGCTLKPAAGVDPLLPALLLLAVWYVLRGRRA